MYGLPLNKLSIFAVWPIGNPHLLPKKNFRAILNLTAVEAAGKICVSSILIITHFPQHTLIGSKSPHGLTLYLLYGK
jgi:hypothetical protein